MGDGQFGDFGLLGATALGWITLEGNTATPRGYFDLSRDQSKVFNYSRIPLLLQANADMLPDQRLAEHSYASNKRKDTQRADVFGRKFWFGGTVSFVFNKLEGITLSQRPTTPALSKKYLPTGLPSPAHRLNGSS